MNTVLMGFTRDSVLQYYEEIPNVWMGGLHIHEVLGEKYENDPYALDREGVPMTLARDPRLLISERIALLTTLDYAVVAREDFRRLSEALREFDAVNPPDEGLSNLSEQADLIDSIYENSPSTYYICWNQSDSNIDDWSNDFGETPNPYDKTDPMWSSWIAPVYDFEKENKHWFVFDFI